MHNFKCHQNIVGDETFNEESTLIFSDNLRENNLDPEVSHFSWIFFLRDKRNIGFIKLSNRHSHVSDIVANNIPIFMKENC